jgi:hypothetical protein
MQMGLFSREGRYLVGRIGALILSWDRHEGGRLTVTQVVDGEPVEVGRFSMHAQLQVAHLSSTADADPRLIPVEAGPHRLVLRAVQRLCDADGIHLGDAMQETWAWSDGSVYLNAMVRLVNPGRGGALVAAGAEFVFAEGWRASTGPAHRLVHNSGWRVEACCYRNGELWAHPAGVAEPVQADVRATWEPVEDGAPPFYRYWGPYIDQWGGAPGWSSVRLADGNVLDAAWVEGEQPPRQSTVGFQGLLAILGDADDEGLDRKVRAFHQPLWPTVEGGKVLHYSPMEGTTVIRQIADSVRVRFPADAEERQVRLNFRREASRMAARVFGDDPTVALALTDGGVADDPNGPNLLRPDDRHGPILTDEDRPPEEVLTTVSLAADQEVAVELASTPGIWIASQRWDERQNLLLYSTAHPHGHLGAFCLRDLKMRDLRIPGATDPLMARLPLYWFKANANSAHHCLNQPISMDLLENGPDAVAFRVVAQNPAGTARSDIEVTIPFLPDRLRLDLKCHFTALETWDLSEVQYCNFFPEEQRYPECWTSDRVLVLAEDGQRMRIDHRAGGTSRLQSGKVFQQYEGRLFVALYGGSKGSILALSQPRSIPGATLEYALCASWLDNHLYLASRSDTIAAGTQYDMDLSLVLGHTTNVDEDMESLGWQALASGNL